MVKKSEQQTTSTAKGVIATKLLGAKRKKKKENLSIKERISNLFELYKK